MDTLMILTSRCRAFIEQAEQDLADGELGPAIIHAIVAHEAHVDAAVQYGRSAPFLGVLRHALDTLDGQLVVAATPIDVDPEAVVAVLVEVMRLLVTRDGQEIADDLILERARNGATALLGAFDVRASIDTSLQAENPAK